MHNSCYAIKSINVYKMSWNPHFKSLFAQWATMHPFYMHFTVVMQSHGDLIKKWCSMNTVSYVCPLCFLTLPQLLRKQVGIVGRVSWKALLSQWASTSLPRGQVVYYKCRSPLEGAWVKTRHWITLIRLTPVKTEAIRIKPKSNRRSSHLCHVKRTL